MRAVLSLTIILFIGLQLGIPQDQIITTNNDTISCRITRVETGFYHFSMQFGEGYRNTLISTSDVKQVLRNHETVHLVPEKLAGRTKPYAFLGYLVGGLGYRTARISPDFHSDVKEYLQELKVGSTVEGALHYYVSDIAGYGFTFSNFHAQNGIESIDLSDDINITYFGPSFQTQLGGKSDDYYFISTTSLGYLKYHNESRAGYNLLFESATMGFKFDFRMAVPLSEKGGLLVGLSYLRGQLYSMTISNNEDSEFIDFNEDEYEGLNRVDLNMGFYFNN